MSNAATLAPVDPPAPGQGHADETTNWVQKIIRTFFSPSAGTVALAILGALVIGALIVVFFDPQVQATMGYFFQRPGDFFSEAGRAFSSFFSALVRGAIFDWTQPTFAKAIRPATESIVRAIPLIIAGLAIALSFTAGLFNIGVQGQIILGAIFGGYVGLALNLPPVVHLLVAILAAVIGGALWGFIPGILKAQLGANEVIVTIMLNSIALLLLQALLNTEAFHGTGYAGKSMPVGPNAVYPLLMGSGFRLHFGFLVAILAAVFLWWLLDRSTFGFELRAAGANPEAANTAGINVKRTMMLTLVLSGALAGLAATAPVLGTEKGLSVGLAGTIGFDAITVALLGKSRPMGVFFAGLLFGALNAGGALMQSSAGIPVDIVQITQAIIVLMIAGSEAVRWMRQRRKQDQQTVEKVEVSASKEGAVA
ncbi:ABC transporter permease [Scrofimicrobium sp. R131]|uniref:ABC transporter permease n=1 Tax=Scrofimicrobium appendicitidis TaxID=3079930 RepID=A0AAU7V8L1_9ACTO